MGLLKLEFVVAICCACVGTSHGQGNHAFEVLRTANQTYEGVDFFVIQAKLPANGLSASPNWCSDYKNLCAGYGLRPTGCGEDYATEGGSRSDPDIIRCVTEYNSDPYINNVLGCGWGVRVAEVANLAFSAGATWERSFGFTYCRTDLCQRGIYGSRWSLRNTEAAFGSDGSGDRIVYTVCAGSAGNCGCAHVCIHTLNGHRCACRPGYTLMMDLHGCEDIDECATDNGGCAQTCTNVPGSYTCSCRQGFVLVDEHRCEDTDECATDNGGCAQNCNNVPGSYYCSCQEGFVIKIDGHGCNDTDECATDNGGCAQTCTNVPGSFTCSCQQGFVISDEHGCADTDECATDNGGCAQTCTNVPGSYTCSCRQGFALKTDGRGCEDVNECEETPGICAGHHTALSRRSLRDLKLARSRRERQGRHESKMRAHSSRSHRALIALSSRSHRALIALSSRSHPALIALSSRSHRTLIALSSRSHRARIPLSSRSHRALIALSSRSHRALIPLSSRSHPRSHRALIPLSSRSHPALIALSSRSHPALIPLSSRSHRALIALSSRSHRAPNALSSRSYRALIPLLSRSHRALIALSSRSHPAPIPLPSRSHPALIPLSSRSHRALIPLPSRSHPALIPLSSAPIPLPSRSHPALIALSSRSHPALIALPSRSKTAPIPLSFRSHSALIPLPSTLSSCSHSALIPLSSRSHRALIPLSSRSHPALIPLSSSSHRAPIPLSSRSHPALIPLSSRSHPALILLSSRSHPALIPLSSRSHRALIPLSSRSHRALIALPSRSHRALIPLSSRSHRALILLSSCSHRALIPLSSCSHPALIALSSRSHRALIELSSRSHPALIPLSSSSHRAPIPLSSRSHPALILLSSRSHPALIALSSSSHPAPIPLSSRSHQALIALPSGSHRALILLSSRSHPALIALSSCSHPALIPLSSRSHPALITLSSRSHRALIALSSRSHRALIPLSSRSHRALIALSSCSHRALILLSSRSHPALIALSSRSHVYTIYVDECSGEHSCDENAFCANQPGSYSCVCQDGFTGNGTTCTEIVPTTTPTSPATTVQSTTATTAAEYTTPAATSTVSTETSTSSAAPSTTSTSLKATTTKGDAIDSEDVTTSPPPTPIVTFVSHEPPETSESSPQQTRTINTIADLQYDKDDPGSILDQLIPYKGDKGSYSEDRKVDSTTCTDAMAALARLSRASSAEDSTETMAMVTSDVIALCGTLPLDAQAEGSYVVGAMADSIKRGALGGASMEELAPTAAGIPDSLSLRHSSLTLVCPATYICEVVWRSGSDRLGTKSRGGHRGVPDGVGRFGDGFRGRGGRRSSAQASPRKREEFRQKMQEKLREKQERQWAYRREVTRELQRNLDSIADALLDSKGGAGRVELGSRAVQMVLEKTSGGRLGGAAVSAHAGGVTLPGPRALTEGGVVGYDRNPYVWDESAKDIKSSVVDIELKQAGRGTLKVKDLSEDITVVLKNAPDMFPAPRLVKYSPFPNDTMVFRTFSARRNQTYGVLVSLVAPYPAALMYGKLGGFPNQTDYDFKKEFSWDDFIAKSKTVPPDGDVHVTYTVLQPDTAGDNGTEEYTIGLKVDGCPPEGCPYSVDITRLDCVFWDPGIDAELGSWKRDGCRVSPASTLAHTVCLCDHLTGFGTSGGTEPNRINFKTVFSKFKDLVNNYAVWTTMVVVMGMYFVLIYPARRKDKADEQKWSIRNAHGNRRRHRSRFLVRVDTGHDWGAGTRSTVGFVLTGEKGSTGPRSFQQDDMTFQTGGVNTFLLTTPQKLGGLTSLTVWHDNSGEGRHASWLLERVEVTDLRTTKKTQFVCNGWLGVEHGDGCLKRTLPPTAESDVPLGQRFSLKLREKFKDGHVWLSVVTSRPKSYFSRVQRLSCCVCLLFCKMITSAMWFRGSGQGASSVVLTIGSVQLTAEMLLVSLWTTLQTFPINFIIVQIFRRCRPKGVPKSSGLQLPYWSVYAGWALLVLTTLASGFFLLLYSMEWGRDKSIQWLTAFGLSFLQSMVVVQPAESSVLVARRRATPTTRTRTRMLKQENASLSKAIYMLKARLSYTDTGLTLPGLANQHGDETLPAEPLAAWSELQETEQLKQQRAERKNWLQLTNNARQCILGIIIITAASLMVHEVWTPSAPAINQRLKAGFSNGTDSVKTQKDVLPWLEGAFARQLYPTQQYNGDALDWRDSVFIRDMPAYRVGPVRLGQIRAQAGKCDVPLPALHSNKPCVMPHVSGTAGEAAASFPESSPATFSHVLRGTMGSYGGPGHRVNLGETRAEMTETLRILKANRWIDPYTAALVLDLTLYHVNANLFSTVSVLFEFPPSAGAIATLKVSTFPLTAQGMAPTLLFVGKAVFVACLLYVTIRLVKNARQEGRSFLLQVWTGVEVASVATSLYVIGAMASKDAFAGKAKSLISQELQKGA
ncbi:hypothetical protein Bbelb_327980 [Branchiostoma belcheri]|nr:hypothetical protein Bbelb_327980 [Branchiostoma belcheri]